MARVTINTPSYKPLTLQEKLAPYEVYSNARDEYYKKRDDLLAAQDTLAINKSSLDSLLTSLDEDKSLKQSIDLYNTILGDLESDIYSKNLTEARRNLVKATQYYNSNLNPIKDAYSARIKAIEEYDKLKLNGDYIGGLDPRTKGVSAYMNGERPSSYGINGSTLYGLGMTDAKAASARAREILQDFGINDYSTAQYFLQKVQEGYSQEDLQEAINDIANISNITDRGERAVKLGKASELANLIEDSFERINEQVGLDNFGRDSNEFKQAYNAVLNGWIAGVTGNVKEDHLLNHNYKGTSGGTGGKGGGGEDPIKNLSKPSTTPITKKYSPDKDALMAKVKDAEDIVSKSIITSSGKIMYPGSKAKYQQSYFAEHTLVRGIEIKLQKDGSFKFIKNGDTYTLTKEGAKRNGKTFKDTKAYIPVYQIVSDKINNSDPNGVRLSEAKESAKGFINGDNNTLEGIKSWVKVQKGINSEIPMTSSYDYIVQPTNGAILAESFRNLMAATASEDISNNVFEGNNPGLFTYDGEKGYGEPLTKKQTDDINDITITNVRPIVSGDYRGYLVDAKVPEGKNMPSRFIYRSNDDVEEYLHNNIQALRKAVLSFDSSTILGNKDKVGYPTLKAEEVPTKNVVEDALDDIKKNGNKSYASLLFDGSMLVVPLRIINTNGNVTIAKEVFTKENDKWERMNTFTSESGEGIINGLAEIVDRIYNNHFFDKAKRLKVE